MYINVLLVANLTTTRVKCVTSQQNKCTTLEIIVFFNIHCGFPSFPVVD